LVERSHFTVGAGEPVASASKLALCPSTTVVLTGFLVTAGGVPAALITLSGALWLLELVSGAAAAEPAIAKVSSIASRVRSIPRERRGTSSPSGCALPGDPSIGARIFIFGILPPLTLCQVHAAHGAHPRLA
jgi:hypothetical protein